MDRTEIVELARITGAPAVSVLTAVPAPLASHPEWPLHLRELVEQARRAAATWWDPDAAEAIGRQLDDALGEVPGDGDARGLALLATPEEHRVLRLPFAVEEEVVVDTTFATRPLLEGLARWVAHRIVVLDGSGARLLEGAGDRAEEVRRHGFPVRVDVPTEQDTPHADRPRHEGVREEDRRTVERAVARALAAADRADPRPVVVVGGERRVAALLEVAPDLPAVAGVVALDLEHEPPARIAAEAAPVVGSWLGRRRAAACARLREAVGTGKAVATLPAVLAAVKEGRGREIVVEEGFAQPRRWVDGLAPGDRPDPRIDVEDVVDDTVEQLLLAGGDVTFVAPGSLDDCGGIGLLLRW